jgi:hypothetical protein
MNDEPNQPSTPRDPNQPFTPPTLPEAFTIPIRCLSSGGKFCRRIA